VGEEYSSILLSDHTSDIVKYYCNLPHSKEVILLIRPLLLSDKYGLIKSSGLIRRMTSFEWGRNTVVFYYI
jgi:hypothetical protein